MIDVQKLKEHVAARQEWYWKCMTSAGDDMRSYYHGSSRACLETLETIWRLEALDAQEHKND